MYTYMLSAIAVTCVSAPFLFCANASENIQQSNLLYQCNIF